MSKVSWQWLFGQANFDRSEEFEEFRYKFLIVAMVVAGALTGVFIFSSYGQMNVIGVEHMVSMHVFTATALGCWWTLRGRKHLFKKVAWTYEIVAMWEYTSALLFAQQDELRLLWFYTNVPGVFMLLGSRAGWAITAASLAILLGCNSIMEARYSGPALMTATFSLLYMAIFFHVYGNRAVSYFKRMRDYNVELEHLAGHDNLTGVLNARAYYALCDREIRLAQRSGRNFSVLFIDLDHFKSINDRHGHAAGDAVLKATAQCLAGSLRASDLLGRIGGEEFSVFLPDTERAGALGLAEQIRQNIEKLCPDIDTGPLKITASVGAATSAGPSQTLQALQQRADQAMYQAKAQGRNRVSCLDAAMLEEDVQATAAHA